MSEHWYDNDSTVGLSIGMLMLARRHARQQAAEAPYKKAEFAAWWEGLTPAQQDAYNLSLAHSQAIDARSVKTPRTERERKRFAAGWVIGGTVLLIACVLSAAFPSYEPAQPLALLLIPVILVLAPLFYWFCEGAIEASSGRRPSAGGPSHNIQGYRSPFDRGELS